MKTIRRSFLVICLLTLCGPRLGAAQSVDSTLYIVGSGDRFIIEFFQSNISPLQTEVSLEGFAGIPTVGSIPVAGHTLVEARNMIRRALAEKYPGADVSITLTQARTQRTLISGAVANPGLYDLPATAFVSDAIAKAGGLLPAASRRNITLRDHEHPIPVDLEMFTRAGDLAANPALYRGDAIHVPLYSDSSQRIYVTGQVRMPTEFEFTGRDRVREALALAGGAIAPNDQVTVSVFTNDDSSEPKQVTVTSDMILPAGSRVVVSSSVTLRDVKDIVVTGEANNPGRYPFKDGMTIDDAIELSGGLTTRASWHALVYGSDVGLTQEAQIVAMLNSDRESQTSPLSLGYQRLRGFVAVGSASNTSQSSLDRILDPGDSIFIPRREGYVKTLGQVKNPGLVAYKPGASIGGLISLSGGLTPEADYSRSFLTRRFTAGAIALSANPQPLDGDVIVIATKSKESKSSFLSTLRDVALIGAGVALTAFAVDQIGD